MRVSAVMLRGLCRLESGDGPYEGGLGNVGIYAVPSINTNFWPCTLFLYRLVQCRITKISFPSDEMMGQRCVRIPSDSRN